MQLHERASRRLPRNALRNILPALENCYDYYTSISFLKLVEKKVAKGGWGTRKSRALIGVGENFSIIEMNECLRVLFT